MNGINVTQNMSDDDDVLVLKVVKPNLVTPNKLSTICYVIALTPAQVLRPENPLSINKRISVH